MRVIDTDGHVVETERTWDFMDPSDAKYRPYIATEKNASGRPREQWVIDGRMVRGRHPSTRSGSRHCGDAGGLLGADASALANWGDLWTQA